ncbi:MAG: prepilin-type N-terminal cleavage/methylation domain-containing protein [Opitutaceae bacterium]|nr:prepilin-type N-terminal cleavage/methylation domain-containing protein [Opitutaceae bacterium]
MITTTQLPIPDLVPARRDRRKGFTLVEILIGASLSTFILAGVMTSFLFLGRSGANLQNYSDMEAQARRGLEYFAEDVRQASAITWNSATSVTLIVNSGNVTYAYNSTTRIFTRNTVTLISGITPGTFSFKSYNVTGAEMPLTNATELLAAGSSTKQLQISLSATRTSTTVVAATNTVLSARFILRNKIVTA